MSPDLCNSAHAGQTRKGAAREPCAVHVAAVAAAWLHDTVEDCGVTGAEIAARFGATVASVVPELTDDKALPRPARKRLQVVNAPGKSPRAALVKRADKTSNLRDILASPPVHRDRARQLACVDRAEAVVGALPGTSVTGVQAFGAVALAVLGIAAAV